MGRKLLRIYGFFNESVEEFADALRFCFDAVTGVIGMARENHDRWGR